MKKQKIAIIFGTRPEAIKFAPVVKALEEHPRFHPLIILTAQHREMLDQIMSTFDLSAHKDLNLMVHNQELTTFMAKALESLSKELNQIKPDWVLVQGDTATTFIGALSAFHNNIPIGHIEAGLRTYNKLAPWPEETNRVLTTHLADLHFAPTPKSRENLMREGIDAENIFVTGNTSIDALKIASHQIKKMVFSQFGYIQNRFEKLVLITGHRRENFGNGIRSVCQAIKQLSKMHPKVAFVYPVHLNPNIKKPVLDILGSNYKKNIFLLEPQPYLPFIYLMTKSHIILTDSGGIQEEAPGLGKPVLVMRETTERAEAIEAGTANLIGTNTQTIIDGTNRLFTDSIAYQKMAQAKNPYGDGNAAERIVDSLLDYA